MRAEMYDLHGRLEDSHWWFTARRTIVLSLIRRELGAGALRGTVPRLLDVGCGTGGVLRHLAQFGSAIGVDSSPAAVELATAKGLEVRLGALPDGMPFEESEHFSIITLLDVLEHIDDDAAALHTLHDLLTPDGRLLVTVPAFMFLWSDHDVINEHRRRYHRSALVGRLDAAGFDVLNVSYFNTALFAPIAALRLVRRWMRRGATLPADATSDLNRVPEPLNRMLHHLFAAERFILRRSSLPFGVSLIAIARRAAQG